MLVRIAAMFLLRFYIVGAIYTTMALVLGSHGLGAYIGVAYSVAGFAALFASMCLGEIADRYVPPKRLLAVCHVVSGLALWFAPDQIVAGHAWPFLLLLIAYTVFGDGSTSVCTRIAFHSVADSTANYAATRAFGTIGFLAAGLVTGFAGFSASVDTFRIGALASFVLALYALTLPDTPAPAVKRRMSLLDVFGWETFGLLRERSFLVFMALTVIICFPMSAYNAYVPVYLKDNGVSNVGGLMTLGQVTEFILMFCLGYLIRRIGMRWIFALACFAWFLIAGTFAVANDVSLPLIVFAILVRGAGWDFFYASSEVYINGKATAELKTRGQSLLRTATYGLGTIVGSLGSGAIYNAMTSGGTAQAGLHWSTFWGIVAIVPLVLFFLVLCAFRDDGRQPSTRPEVLGTV